jgi:hypothetical protein
MTPPVNADLCIYMDSQYCNPPVHGWNDTVQCIQYSGGTCQSFPQNGMGSGYCSCLGYDKNSPTSITVHLCNSSD